MWQFTRGYLFTGTRGEEMRPWNVEFCVFKRLCRWVKSSHRALFVNSPSPTHLIYGRRVQFFQKRLFSVSHDGSMYGIYMLTLGVYGGILMVNVTIYTIHGSYGYGGMGYEIAFLFGGPQPSTESTVSTVQAFFVLAGFQSHLFLAKSGWAPTKAKHGKLNSQKVHRE